MKKQLKASLLVTLLASYCLPSLAQSTQGKEFWVSSSIVCSPTKDKGIVPYIAVSAENACTVKIQGGVGNAINITQQVAAGSWNEFGNGTTSQTNPNAGMIKVPMDASKWYPIDTKEPATVCSLAGQKNMYGLHITANENISVYVILSGESAMDASNILPLTALGSEYYTQDFKPEAHNNKSWSTNEGNMVTVTTILATEDNTQVDITPQGATYDGHASGVLYTIDLNKGQTYYLISQKEQQLAGTHIVARNGKKIAIYTGSPLTRLPNEVSARDALFEQPLPVDYWGTQFIVTRSLEKNGNIIGITAIQNGTEIKLDGYPQNPAIYINEGETYYIALQNAGNPQGKKPGSSRVDKTIIGDALFIETSCPCAVYNYDTGNSYKGDNDEIVNSHGDPSSVWVSPIQQKINRITFGTCYTNNTKDHFLNIVTETATCNQTQLTALYGATQLDKTTLLSWIPVPGNPKYSYTRAKIGDASTSQYSVFRLENPRGFIATVYGNGEDESYAYSAGSAAVEQGVNVDGETFTEGYRSDTKFCLNTDLTFDAKVGTDEITRVDWNFGDGTTEYQGLPQVTHRYTSPGWYDVTANLFGNQVCTDESNVPLGAVHFTFRVVRPDTIVIAPERQCLTIKQQDSILTNYGQARLDSLTTFGERKILNPDAPCYEDKQMSLITYGLETERIFDSIVTDGAEINGKWYDTDAVISWSDTLPFKCPQHYTCSLKVITCLKMTVDNDSAKQNICPGEDLNVVYTKTKGDIESARFVIAGIIDTEIIISNDNTQAGTITLPVADITTPGIYKGRLIVKDAYEECDFVDLPFDIDITVKYPNDIFLYKFNNVLAVYKKGYGGNDNYDFKNYEWHVLRNGQDSLLSAGENESVLYLGEGNTFEIGDQVYVVLTDMRGVAIPSCSQTITKVDDYTIPDPEQAPARKMLQQNRFVILKGDKTYDIYGQKVR